MNTDHIAGHCARQSQDLPLFTEAQARAALAAAGLSVADWARGRGFSPELARMVLAGKRKCLRGQSHRIAVALGLK